MDFDVWFARDENGDLWFNLADPGEAPDTSPSKCKSVRHALAKVRGYGHKVAQVGIADMEMIRI